MTTFTGFPAEGVQFLRDLSENNNKDWFQAHKQTYIDTVQQPAVAFVEALGEQLSAEFPPISYDTRLNGSGSLMRIYRDTRFSADKSPYKTQVAMMFVPPGYKSMETSGFGLQISPTEGAELVAGIFGFSKAQLTVYREAVDDPQTGAALVEAVEQVQGAGHYMLGGKVLKRGPRDYAAEHPRAEIGRAHV